MMLERELRGNLYECERRFYRYAESRYLAAIAEFEEDNPQIAVSVRVVEEEQYVAKLTEALENGTVPDVFDSTAIENPEDYGAGSLGNLFAYEAFDAENYWFLTDYMEYFPNQDQLPLAFDIPVVYENSQNEDAPESEDYESYTAGESSYLGWVSDYQRVQADMPGIYQLRQEVDSYREGCFANCWSINASSGRAERAAAVRLLYYLLSDTAQQEIVLDGEGYLPINKNMWEVFVEINPDFEYLKEMLPSVQMESR